MHQTIHHSVLFTCMLAELRNPSIQDHTKGKWIFQPEKSYLSGNKSFICCGWDEEVSQRHGICKYGIANGGTIFEGIDKTNQAYQGSNTNPTLIGGHGWYADSLYTSYCGVFIAILLFPIIAMS